MVISSTVVKLYKCGRIVGPCIFLETSATLFTNNAISGIKKVGQKEAKVDRKRYTVMWAQY